MYLYSLVELDHLKPNFVHEFFKIQLIGIIHLEQFKEVLQVNVYKKCQSKSYKSWYSLTSKAFFAYMYKAWHILDSPQDFAFPFFSICSSLFFFVLAVRDFSNSGRCNQIILWKIPWHLGLFTIEALRANGNNYGTCEEGSLFGLLRTLVSMWSFFWV